MRIAFIDGGTYYHHATYHDPQFQPLFSRNIYICDLPDADLSDVDCLYIASRQNPADLLIARETITRFLSQGKLVIVMGECGVEQWLDRVRWQSGETNFWWWLEENADPGLRLKAPQHGLFRYISLKDATWHHHGSFVVPPDATSLIDAEGEGSILYETRLPGGGRMLLTTLDPCYHHGSYFMPNTTRFITGLLNWLHAGAPE